MDEDCGICGALIAEESDALVCKGCKTPYHRQCRIGTGRCVTEGCKRNRGEHPDAIKNREAARQAGEKTDITPYIDNPIGKRIVGILLILAVGAGVMIAKALGFEL